MTWDRDPDAEVEAYALRDTLFSIGKDDDHWLLEYDILSDRPYDTCVLMRFADLKMAMGYAETLHEIGPIKYTGPYTITISEAQRDEIVRALSCRAPEDEYLLRMFNSLPWDAHETPDEMIHGFCL